MSKASGSDEKMPVRRELGEAMMEFVRYMMSGPIEEMDDVMRQVATEKYRQAVMKAAAQGIELSLTWHTLGVWLEEGKDRIGAFARALECARAERASPFRGKPVDPWSATHMEAECLYEIGRVHFYEGAPDAARQFLEQALPLAQKAETLRTPGKQVEDGLEGKIASLLVQL
jgi:hypothetical protein